MERVDAFHPEICRAPERHARSPRSLRRARRPTPTPRATRSSGRRADDVAIVPAATTVCLVQARRGKGRVVTFGPGGDVDVRAGRRSSITRARHATRARASASQGGHNALNVAAAVAAVGPLRARPSSSSQEVLEGFRGLAASHGARSRARRRALLRRLEGHERRRLGHRGSRRRRGAASCSSPAVATRAAATGRSSMRSASKGRAVGRCIGEARRAHPRRDRRRGARAARDVDGRSRRASPPSSRRPGDAVLLSPGVLELRHVPRLQGARRRLRRAPSSRAVPEVRVHDPRTCAACRSSCRCSSRSRSTRSRSQDASKKPGRRRPRRARRRADRLRRRDGLQRVRRPGDAPLPRPAVLPEASGGLRRRSVSRSSSSSALVDYHRLYKLTYPVLGGVGAPARRCASSASVTAAAARRAGSRSVRCTSSRPRWRSSRSSRGSPTRSRRRPRR